jgi:hypothetical protein
MRVTKLVVLIALLVAAIVASNAQNTGRQDTGSAISTAPSAGASNPAAGTVAQSAQLRVISPKQGQQLTQSFVNVRFELKNPNTASNFPNFRVQLDGQDPVRTTSPEYTFTGLAPGKHFVTVEMVDANETPIPGTRTEVHFVVLPPPAGNSPGMAQQDAPQEARVIKASLIPEAQNTPNKNVDPIPSTGSSLPLLSVIGFGVLLGGIASALKTR